MIAPGFAFFNREAPGVPRHLWLVLSDPAQDAERVVIANLSTKPGPDHPGCIMAPGEHPGISRPSFLRCEHARIVPEAHLEALAGRGLIAPTQPGSDALLNRLRAALMASPHAPVGAKAILARQGCAAAGDVPVPPVKGN